MDRSVRRAAALVAVMALGVSACGDDDEAGPRTSSAEAVAAPSSSAPGAARPVNASEEPIKIGVIGPFQSQGFAFDELRQGVTAAVAALNERGGLAGRPVEVEACNDGLVEPQAAECFRRFADDEDVLALVGGGSPFLGANVETFTASGLAWIGNYPSTPVDLTQAGVYLSSGGLIGESYAMVKAAAEAGANRLAVMLLSDAVGQFASGWVQDAASAFGVDVVETVHVDVTAVDLSAAAAKLTSSSPDAILLGGLDTQQQLMAKLVREAGFDGLLVAPGTRNGSEFVAALGDAGDGLLAVSMLAPVAAPDASSVGLERLRAEVGEYEPDAKINGFLTSSWLAVQLLATVVDQIEGDITREAIAQAASSLSEFDTEGITGSTLTWGQPGPFEAAPNAVNSTFAVMEARAGQWTWDGKFLDARPAAVPHTSG